MRLFMMEKGSQGKLIDSVIVEVRTGAEGDNGNYIKVVMERRGEDGSDVQAAGRNPGREGREVLIL